MPKRFASSERQPLGGRDVAQLLREVRVDARQVEPLSRRLEQEIPALGHRLAAPLEVEQRRCPLAPVERLQERLRERAPEPERLADGAHLAAEPVVRVRELLEVEARRLHRDVVERGLERRRRLLRDVVRQLVERVADREQRRDLRDREAGRLRGERRRARHARVHLDHAQLARLGLVGELHVRAAGRDADRARTGEGRLAQALVLGVGQRLLRRDGPRVAGVHAHRVEVLDRADDDAVARVVAHHLELELLPALERLLDEHLPDRARREPGGDALLELLRRPGDAAAAAAERERGADDRRHRTCPGVRQHGRDDFRQGHLQARPRPSRRGRRAGPRRGGSPRRSRRAARRRTRPARRPRAARRRG